MVTRLITAPASEPVTLAEVKMVCRIDTADEDALLTSYISAARGQCEHILGRSLLPQTWENVLASFPCENIELLYPTIISITSVKYIDATTANEVTVATDQYVLDKDNEPGNLMPAVGVSWPNALNIDNAVRVRYQAGYANAAAVPEGLKNWIKLAVRAMYQGCGQETLGQAMKPFDSLLDRYRIWTL